MGLGHPNLTLAAVAVVCNLQAVLHAQQGTLEGQVDAGLIRVGVWVVSLGETGSTWVADRTSRNMFIVVKTLEKLKGSRRVWRGVLGLDKGLSWDLLAKTMP